MDNAVVPAFENNIVPLALSANEGFVPILSTMLVSVIDHISSDSNYDVVILHSSISEESQEMIRDIAEPHENVSIRFFEVSELIGTRTFYTENNENVTAESYYRLLIPELFQLYEKVIYLDCDMIVLEDIKELLDFDMGENLLISSRDYWGICHLFMGDDADAEREYRVDLGLKKAEDYFISGMLVFNIPAWNGLYTCEEVLEFAESRKWRHHDQDILNILADGRTLLISSQWDYMYDKYSEICYLPQAFIDDFDLAREDPKIIHYGVRENRGNTRTANTI